MKTYIYLSFLLLFILVFTPALAIPADPAAAYEELEESALEKAKSVFAELPLHGIFQNDGKENEKSSDKEAKREVVKTEDEETISVMLRSSGKTVDIAMKEYLCGAVAGEMPAVYELEALKAQAVACYTYAKTKEAAGVVITDNPEINQSYLSKEELQKKWGDKYDAYFGKIEKAVTAVMGEYLTYDGELVSTIAYHAISSGNTESASDIWGGNPIPYLVSVDSSADLLSPNYKVTTVYTFDQIKDKLEKAGVACDFSSYTDETVIGGIVRTVNGAVKTVTVCGIDLSGAEFRSALGLRSLNYSISVKNKAFTVVTLGYGHGVGMSQYGANMLAGSGMTYKEILAHYYPGTEISSNM